MAGTSLIEWTDASWNPVVGCSVKSPGCDNCYAMWLGYQFEHHRPNKPVLAYKGTTKLDKKGRRVWTGKVNRASDKSFDAPLHWPKPKRIFTNSMADLFHIKIADKVRREVFEIIDQCPHHTFQMLTKRPENQAFMLKAIGRDRVPDHLWLGCTVEGGSDIIDPHTRRPVTDRLDMMRKVDAKVRWVSFEPLIGPVGKVDLTGISWAVIGGESGKTARKCDPAWGDDLIRQCREQGVAVFFKQWGKSQFNPDPNDPTMTESAGGCQVHGEIIREFPESPKPKRVTLNKLNAPCATIPKKPKLVTREQVDTALRGRLDLKGVGRSLQGELHPTWQLRRKDLNDEPEPCRSRHPSGRHGRSSA
jgi:protein gp37